MGAVAAIGIGFGAAFSAVSAYQAGQYEADIRRQNAAIGRKRAADALVRGQEDAETFSQEVDMLIGAQRVSLAAQGIDVNEGTALDIQAGTREMGELDILKILNNASREAWGYAVGVTNAENQANLAEFTGRVNAVSNLTAAGFGVASIEDIELIGDL